MKPRRKIADGERNGTNTVLQYVRTQGKMRFYLVRCDCGMERELAANCVRAVEGCPRCYGASKRIDPSYARKADKLYEAWCSMRARCRTGKHWAGRGITVCTEWQDHGAFRAWALANGWRQGLSLERINADGNYEPTNCEWITRSENSRRAGSATMRRRKLAEALLSA